MQLFKTTTGIAGLAAVALVAGPGGLMPRASAEYLSEDFQGQTVGAEPNNADFVNNPAPSGAGQSTDIRVVDANSTPADPFGGVGNQSLLLEDLDDGTNPSIRYAGTGPGLTEGRLSIQFYLVDNGDDLARPFFRIRVGNDNVQTSNRALDFRTGDQLEDVTPNVAHVLVLDFDTDVSGATDGTYTATLDGTAVSHDNGNTTFAFERDVDEIQAVNIVGGYTGLDDSRIFVDNISIGAVPEPGAMSLMGLGGLALLGRRRSDR